MYRWKVFMVLDMVHYGHNIYLGHEKNYYVSSITHYWISTNFKYRAWILYLNGYSNVAVWWKPKVHDHKKQTCSFNFTPQMKSSQFCQYFVIHLVGNWREADHSYAWWLHIDSVTNDLKNSNKIYIP